MKTRGVAAFLAPALLLALVACGGSSATVSSSAPVPPHSPTPTSGATQSPRTLTLDLNPLQGAAAHGSVLIEVKGDGYTMTVTVEGLTPNSIHTLYINSGSCAAIKSDVDTTVAQDVRADASGKATSMTTYHDAYSIPAEGRVLVVHGDEPAQSQVRLACAELTS
ncbi:MAG: superoxide dismutase family protein [Chloroflexota bacterium]|nr:superoxide dismutase family protein [Chloroflexota bacterium]